MFSSVPPGATRRPTPSCIALCGWKSSDAARRSTAASKYDCICASPFRTDSAAAFHDAAAASRRLFQSAIHRPSVLGIATRTVERRYTSLLCFVLPCPAFLCFPLLCFSRRTSDARGGGRRAAPVGTVKNMDVFDKPTGTYLRRVPEGAARRPPQHAPTETLLLCSWALVLLDSCALGRHKALQGFKKAASHHSWQAPASGKRECPARRAGTSGWPASAVRPRRAGSVPPPGRRCRRSRNRGLP